MKQFRWLAGVALIALLGCVSKPIEQNLPPPLMIGQNGEGDVSLAWKSKVGFDYTIYEQATPMDDWVALKNGFQVPGTGRTITIEHKVDPSIKMPKYRIIEEPVE